MTASKDSATEKKEKKEKLFHPQSRKAGQLERKNMRSAKLKEAASKKVKKDMSSIDRHSFFYHALPPEVDSLTLAQLHDLIQSIWLTRHDDDINSEANGRRKGRPPSAKEVKLRQQRDMETEEYRTGMEVIDLTHRANVELLRRWKQDDQAFLQILRYIRLSSGSPEQSFISRPGKHENLLQEEPITSRSEVMQEDVPHVES